MWRQRTPCYLFGWLPKVVKVVLLLGKTEERIGVLNFTRQGSGLDGFQFLMDRRFPIFVWQFLRRSLQNRQIRPNSAPGDLGSVIFRRENLDYRRGRIHRFSFG